MPNGTLFVVMLLTNADSLVLQFKTLNDGSRDLQTLTLSPRHFVHNMIKVDLSEMTVYKHSAIPSGEICVLLIATGLRQPGSTVQWVHDNPLVSFHVSTP